MKKRSCPEGSLFDEVVKETSIPLWTNETDFLSKNAFVPG